MYTCWIKAHNIILKWRSRQFHVHCTYRAYALGECNGLWWLAFAFERPGNLEFCRKVICWEAIYFLHGFCLQTQTKTKPKKGAWDQAQQWRKGKKRGEGGGKGGGAWRHAFDGPPFHDARLPSSPIFLSSLNFFRLFPHCGDWFQATKKAV